MNIKSIALLLCIILITIFATNVISKRSHAYSFTAGDEDDIESNSGRNRPFRGEEFDATAFRKRTKYDNYVKLNKHHNHKKPRLDDDSGDIVSNNPSKYEKFAELTQDEKEIPSFENSNSEFKPNRRGSSYTYGG